MEFKVSYFTEEDGSMSGGHKTSVESCAAINAVCDSLIAMAAAQEGTKGYDDFMAIREVCCSDSMFDVTAYRVGCFEFEVHANDGNEDRIFPLRLKGGE